MKARYLAVLTATIALAACGGGGGTAPSSPVAPAATPTPPPPGVGTIPMTISIPLRTTSASARSPRFFSPGAGSLTIYDGSTLIYVANLALDSTPAFTTVYAKAGGTSVAFGSCTFTSSEATCTLTLTATTGAHNFDILVYPGSQPAGSPPAITGVISSEGELSVTLNLGTNTGQTMTLLGVADKLIIAGPATGPFNQATQFGYRINDSTNSQIVLPGSAYDNGPITITAAPAGIVTIAPNSIATPPASVGDQNFNVTCVNSNGGAVTISVNALTSPTTSYASGLTYSTSNYSAATIGTAPFTCNPSTATIPITVNSRKRT
jgi:hypothetical protein